MTTETTMPTNEPHQQQQQSQPHPQHITIHRKEMLASMTSSSSWHPSSKPDRDVSESISSQQQIVLAAQSILNDPTIKFPLENSWSFWFFKNEKSKSWKDNVKFITTVDFVEDFWGYFLKFYIVSTSSILFVDFTLFHLVPILMKENKLFLLLFNFLRLTFLKLCTSKLKVRKIGIVIHIRF